MNIWLYPILPITPIALLYMSISDAKWWFRKPNTYYCYRYHKPEWGFSVLNAPTHRYRTWGGHFVAILGLGGAGRGCQGWPVSNIFGGHRGHHEPWKNDTIGWLVGWTLSAKLPGISWGFWEATGILRFHSQLFFGSMGMMKPPSSHLAHLTQLAFEHDHLVRCLS